MKCLKTEEFVRRIATTADATALHNELEGCVSRGGVVLRLRVVCDRILHACYQRLGEGLEAGLVPVLLRLVELAIDGYEQEGEGRTAEPLYLEKMMFHIFQRLLKAKEDSGELALSLFHRLKRAQPQESDSGDYHTLVQSCFSVLWKAAAAVESGDETKTKTKTTPPNHTHAQTHTHTLALRTRLEALRFRLLQERVTTSAAGDAAAGGDSSGGGVSKVCVYVKESLTKYRLACGGGGSSSGRLSQAQAAAMVDLLEECVWGPLWGRDGDGKGSPPPSVCDVTTMCVVTARVCKMLLGAELWDLANQQLALAKRRVQGQGEVLCAALEFCDWAVRLHRLLHSPASADASRIYSACALLLSNVTVAMDAPCPPLAEACQLVAWATQEADANGLAAATLLSCLDFLKQYCIALPKMREASGLQETLCLTLCEAFTCTHTSLTKSQALEGECLQQVVGHLSGSVAELVQQTQKLTNDSAAYLLKAVTTIKGVVFELCNRKLHEEALSLAKPLCDQLVKSRPPSLPLERVSHCFQQQVHLCRRLGDHRGALQAVSDWLLCLTQDELKELTHSDTHTGSSSSNSTHTHPITLWAKIKADAAKTRKEEEEEEEEEDEVRLRTLRDVFSDSGLSSSLLIGLMEVELRAYGELSQDLYQEKYNTLCDLLELCGEEDAEHTHARAHTLLQLAQLTCFHDLTQLTECSPVDFAHEALRLLEEEPVSEEKSDWLKDDTAHASLWLYICQLESSLQEAIATEKRLREEQERGGGVANMEPLPTNDLDQEDRDKAKESLVVYESLNFNLAQHTSRLAALDKSLSLWVELITDGVVPKVRNPTHTTASLFLLASLYTLMSKPLEALRSYQLAQRLARCRGDAASCANALCLSARLLLDLGESDRAQVLLEQAEECVKGAAPSSSMTLISMKTKLLRATLDYSRGEVLRGVCGVCELLVEVEKRHMVSFYLLKAQALQVASRYLNLDTHTLPDQLRSKITEHGLLSPDSAQSEAMKLLKSLVVMLLGDGFYGTSSNNTDNTTRDSNGDSLLLKYQLLSEVCVCSRGLVCVRSRAGAAHEAKLQCLEALRLAAKLQAINHCAALLVCKAEVEYQKGATEESALDLQRVKDLLESCTDSSGQRDGSDVKLHPRKGLLPTGPQAPPTDPQEEDPGDVIEGFLSSCPIPRIMVEGVGVANAQGSSPPLKRQSDWLKSLSHGEECVCLVCSDVTLGGVCVSWALAFAALSTHTQAKASKPTHTHAATRLYRLALRRCQHLSHTLLTGLGGLAKHTHARANAHTHPHVRPAMAKALLGLAESMLGKDLQQASPQLWEVLDKGLKVATPRGHMWAELLELKAELLALKGVACCLAISAKQGVPLEELLSGRWAWNPPKTTVGCKDATDSTTSTHNSKAPPKTPKHTRKVTFDPKTPKETRKVTLDPKTPKDTLSTATPGASKPLSSASKAPAPGFAVFKTPMAPARSRAPLLQDPSFSVFDFAVDSPERSHATAKTPARSSRKNQSTKTPKAAERTPSASSTRTPSASASSTRTPAVKHTPATAKSSSRSFQVYQDTSPNQDTADAPKAPPAPRRTKRCRFKMVFSDESSSDSEEAAAPAPVVIEAKTPQPTRKPRAQKAPATTQRASRGKSQPDATRPDDGGGSSAQPRPRRGRPKKGAVCKEEEDVEVIRATIDGEEDLRGDHSLEIIHLSDNDDAGDDCEILRRDLAADTGRGQLTDIRKAVGQTALAHTLSGADVSLDSALEMLRTSWLLLQHFPPPALFSRLSSLLAQSNGSKHPVTTATLHAEALGISTRHQTTRYLASRMRKKRKGCVEVEEALSALRLSDSREEEEEEEARQIFSFNTAQPDGYPHTHAHRFTQQLERLPPGVTVCLMSVVEACPGMIDTLLLTRLERGSAPLTMRIPTAHSQYSISMCVSELESILEQQKQLNGVCEKSQWWHGRKTLDARMQRLLERMQECLGVWSCLLLPLSDDSALSEELQNLTPLFSSSNITTTMLQAVLSASPLLSSADLQSLLEGVGLDVKEAWPKLMRAAARLENRKEPQGHTVLILDKYLQKLPWECVSCLGSRSVTRMPSLAALLRHARLLKMEQESVLSRGVDPRSVFYVLNPDGNLPDTEKCFKDWFTSEKTWEGVCGSAPTPEQLQESVATKDLYIYVGHGAGSRFLDAGRLLKGHVSAAALLFGCSSAGLSVNGTQEGTGIVLSYITAGCPLVLGNLWDVTDRDIDRLTLALLRSWLKGERGSSLLTHLPNARTQTRLTHMIGAAPVAYGLPVHIK